MELNDVARQSVYEALRKGSKIEAIKIYREATGVGLKEAKEQVETIVSQNPEFSAGLIIGPNSSGGFAIFVVVGIIILAYLWLK